MDFLSLVYLAAVAATAVISLSLAVSAWPLRNRPAVKPFIYHTLAVAEIAVSFLMLSLSPSPEAAFAWARLRFLGLAFTIPLALLFLIELIGQPRLIPRYAIPALFVIPVMIQIVLWSESAVPLFFANWAISRKGLITVEILHWGVWFHLHSALGYGVSLTDLILLMIYIWRSKGVERLKTLWVLAGCAAGVGIVVLGMADRDVLPFNLTPIGLLVTTLCYSRAVLRYRLLELMPAAYTTLFSNMQDAILVANESGELVQMNPSAEMLFGKRSEPLIGKNICLLLPGLAQVSSMAQFETEVGQISVDVRLSTLNKRGHFIGSLYVLRDISDSKRARKEQMKLLADSQRSNEDLRAFAHLVSHDLKAPLRGINSLAHWLVSDHGDQLDDEGRDLAQQINQHVLSMERMINGILEYSLIGQDEDKRNPIALQEILSEMIASFSSPGKIHITLETTLPEVRVEPTRLYQVFQNLIDNAIKYSDKPLCEIRLGCRQQTLEFCIFWVKDNGPGIEAWYHERIFQMFTTLAPRSKTESTGIGLAIVKRIVEYYGGKLWLESQVGEGSTFYLTMPGQMTEPETKT